MKTAKNLHFEILDREWDQMRCPKTGFVFDELVEKVSCPVCGARKNQVLFVKKGLSFVQCPSCSLVFINPQPKQAFLEDHFLKSKAWSVWSKKVLSKEQCREDEKKYEHAFQWLSKLRIGHSPKLLDVGSGAGIFLNMARQRGFEVMGIEPSVKAADFSEKKFGVDIFTGSFEAFESLSLFDIITFWASLEYNKNVQLAIRKAVSLLKPRGLLLIFIGGNAHSLVMRTLREKCVGFIFNRCHSFTPQSLDRLVLNKGFNLKVRYSLISEIGPIENYLSFDDPYLPKKEEDLFSLKDKKLLEDIIERNHMGYKFVSIYRKK
ncbi:MAG: methyltransferase domain-containing protein [Candidatus Omnitrophica bacterium]|nr:methyltransferase domain-containing protein [Candidatus Omnitrophota bacterium]